MATCKDRREEKTQHKKPQTASEKFVVIKTVVTSTAAVHHCHHNYP